MLTFWLASPFFMKFLKNISRNKKANSNLIEFAFSFIERFSKPFLFSHFPFFIFMDDF